MVAINNITKISQVTYEVTLFLRQLGFSNYYIIKIFDLVGDSAISLIEDNPYWLLEEFPHMGFNRIDEISNNLGLPKKDERRLKAGVLYVLGKYIGEGHSYAKIDNFIYQAAELLDVESELIREVIEDMTFEGTVHLTNLNGIEVLYFYRYYRAECNIATNLLKMLDNWEKQPGVTLDESKFKSLISLLERNEAKKFSKEQVTAIEMAMKYGVSIITGGPGTGKTTIIKAIIELFTILDKKVSVAAPTGRAAKRIMETGDCYAQTVHRLLEYFYDETSDKMLFKRNQENPLEADVVIIDESSMLDLLVFDALLDALKPNSILILVGDVNQLKSVGAGNVLGDLIESELFYTTRLTEIYRQSEESTIVLNAHKINKGEYPIFTGDCSLVKFSKQEEILSAMVYRLKKGFPEEIQVLTPTKKGILGTKNLNEKFQDIFNPTDDNKNQISFGDKIFREGDKIMQLKNNYRIEFLSYVDSKSAKNLDPYVSFSREDIEANSNIRKGKGVFNGEIGRIESVDQSNRTLTVVYDEDRWVEYAYSDLDEIEHAYAITIHKSQGSEFPFVMMPSTWFTPLLATRSLIYTGLTRGKKGVVIVGDEKYVRQMVDNNRSGNRNSGLKERLIGTYGGIT